MVVVVWFELRHTMARLSSRDRVGSIAAYRILSLSLHIRVNIGE